MGVLEDPPAANHDRLTFHAVLPTSRSAQVIPIEKLTQLRENQVFFGVSAQGPIPEVSKCTNVENVLLNPHFEFKY